MVRSSNWLNPLNRQRAMMLSRPAPTPIHLTENVKNETNLNFIKLGVTGGGGGGYSGLCSVLEKCVTIITWYIQILFYQFNVFACIQRQIFQ